MKFKEIEMEVSYEGRNVKDGWEKDEWKVSLFYDGREMTTPYSMGTGHHGAEPTLECVLDSLSLDSSAVDMNFDDFCAEFGYNNDSIKALNTYNQCLEIGKDFKYLLGNDFESILEEIYELNQ